jgi:hypothetical protein
MKAYSCFSKLWNEVFGFRDPIELLLPRHVSPFGLCGGALWGDRMPQSGGPQANELLRRFFYSFFNNLTLPEGRLSRAYPQDIVERL